MTNNNKKYEMGGAVQSFSSPMLAQGMQGGLSGFGTSGLGMFADGGQMKLSDFQVGDIVSHKKGKGNAHGRIYKMSAIGFYLEDKYGNKSETHQIFPSDFKKVKKLADGGQISDIERILAKYRAIAANNSKQDKTSEFLNKSWEGKNLDDYIMYSDRYKRGGELSASQERAFFDKTKTKYTQLDADKLVGNFIEIYGQGQEEAIAYSKISKATIDPKYSAKTLIIYTETGTQERIPEDKIDSFFNGLPIVLSIPSKGSYYGLKLKGANEKDLYADGGEVNKYEVAFDKLEIGDVVVLKFDSGVNGGNDLKLTVKSKKLVGKGKPSQSEQITFEIANNLTGKKFYAYKRKNGYVSFGYLGSGEMAVKDISIEKKYADGGQVNKYEATFDELKKGDVVTLKFGSSISRENDVKLIVKSKNLVGKGKTYESEKITFAQANNPTGVKFYAYKRKNGYVGFASGDMAISVNNISIENKYAKGGTSPSLNNGEINGRYLDSLSEIKQRRILMNVANHYEISLEEANDEVRDEEAELLYEYIADDNTLKMSIYYQFQDNLNKYAGGGEFEEEESMDVQFIEYNGNEIMYEPIMKKYYANDVEFDTLQEAQKFLDSGEMSDSIRGAYARGLYDKGGEVKKSSWVVIFAKGNERKVLEVSASTREEAVVEAEKDKKRYGISPDLKLDDIFRKYEAGGDVGDGDGGGSLKVNKESDGKYYWTFTFSNGKIEKSFQGFNTSADAQRDFQYKSKYFAKGGEVDRISIGDNVYAYFAQNYVGYQLVESPSMGEPYDGKVIDIINENNQKKYVVKFENGETKKLSQGIFDDYVIKEKFAKGGEIDPNALTIDKIVGTKIPISVGSQSFSSYDGWTKDEVIDLVGRAIKHNLIDTEFYYNYLSSEYKKEYLQIWNEEIYTKMMKNINNVLAKYFQIATGSMSHWGLQWNLNSRVTDQLIDNFFRYSKKLPQKVKDEYAFYRNDYAGVDINKPMLKQANEWVNTAIEKYNTFGKQYLNKSIYDVPNDYYNQKQGWIDRIEVDKKYKKKQILAKGGEVSSKIYEVEYEIAGKKYTSEYMIYDWERVENKFPPETKIISIKEKHAKGGKIGFEGLAKKVAKRYKGKAVSKEYQAEYGKTYDAKEAKEVGNKVAAKVYRQQVAKKKIVRKLQRKTN